MKNLIKAQRDSIGDYTPGTNPDTHKPSFASELERLHQEKFPPEGGPILNATQWGPILIKEFDSIDLAIKSIRMIIRTQTIYNETIIDNIKQTNEYWYDLIGWMEKKNLVHWKPIKKTDDE